MRGAAARRGAPATARRHAARVGAAALLLLLAAPAQAQQLAAAGGAARRGVWQDTVYIDAVIRLSIESGPSEVVPALTYNSTLMLPLRQYAAMVELNLTAFALRDSALLHLEPGHVPLRFRPSERLLTRGADTVRYDTLDVTWWDGDLFVATHVLDRVLGTLTSVDWVSISSVVGRSTRLPVVMRGRRERRRQLLERRGTAPDVLELALRQRALDGGMASWSFAAAARGPSEQMSLDLGFGAGVLGGSAELRPVVWASEGRSTSDLRWSWQRVWPTSPGIRQLRLGDIQSNGRRARLLEGVAVTNAPFIRSSEFDVEDFVTNVPAGWEAELYGRGRLLAYAEGGDAAGIFRVPLQLGYGVNPYELVLYGPGGQTVRRQRTIRVPFSRLPTGRLEYAAAMGRCRYDPCDALFSADARYGVSSGLTVQGGWDAFFGGTAGTLWQPYAIVSGAPLPELGLTGEAVANGHLRASANYEPTLDLRVNAGVTRFSTSGGVYAGGFGEVTRTEASLFWHPSWRRGTTYLQGIGVLTSGPAMDRRLLRLSGSVRQGAVRYTVGLLHDALVRPSAPTTDRFAIDAGADAVLLGPWPWLRAAAVQGQVAIEPARGLAAMRAQLGRLVGRSLRLDAGLGWVRGQGVALELAVATALPGPRAGARSRVSAGGSEALVYSSGAVAWDPRTNLTRLSDVSDLGRAGISGVLFRDDNANGVRDPGEPGLAGIPLRVGGWPAETDADGRFSAWGMYPTEPLRIDVDTLSLDDPQLVLPAPVLQVRPAPNAFGNIAVPVVVGAEISGFVVLGDEPLGGVPVVLRELNTGAEITVLTFADGGFYRGAVPPGEYEVTLPDAVLERLRAAAPPVSIFVPPGAGEKRFEDLQLRLVALP